MSAIEAFFKLAIAPFSGRIDLLEAGSSAANAALFLATSTTSNAIGTGQKTFTTQSGKAFVAGQFVQVSDQANPANYMLGQVSGYSSTSLVVEVSSVGGSGTKAAWNIALSGPGGATGGISGGTLTGDLGDAPEVTVASAATTNIGAANSNKVVVSGNVTITAFDSVANRRKLLRFTGTPLLTHGANLILPGAANMQMAAGDMAEFTSDGSGVWRMRKYQSVSEANFGRSLLNAITDVAARALLGALNKAGDALTGSLDLATMVDVASAATTDIGAAASNTVRITGTTTITSLGTGANKLRFVRFAAALTLTHDATALILPGGANILTAANDTAIFTSDPSGNWRLRHYTRATGWLAGIAPTGQIPFPASQLASTDPNTLDDYEEGSWTPTLVTDGTSPPDVVYGASNAAGYIKVGKLWIYWGRLMLSSKGTGATGNIRIGGFPAASAADAAATISRWNGLSLTSPNVLTGTVAGNQMRMEQSGPTGNSAVPWSSITDSFVFVFAGVFVGAN